MPRQSIIKQTDEEFKRIVQENFSISQCLKKLGLTPAGGNYKIFHAKVKKLNINTDHFTGKGHLKGKHHNWGTKIETKDILVKDSNFQSHKLKLRLLKENIKEHKCENCNNTTWLGKPIPIELEHCNGINTDNRLENLKLLCPNCHAQTDTYRGKNKRIDK